MNWRIVKTIFFKEILDTVRDRRTLLATVGIPLLLYPAVFVFSSQLIMVQQNAIEEKPSKIAVDSRLASLEGWVAEHELLDVVEVEDGAEALTSGTVDAYLTIDDGDIEALDTGGQLDVSVQYDGTEPASRTASNRLSDRLEEHAEALLDLRLSDISLDRTYIQPLVVMRDNVATAQKTGGAFIGSVLPLLMVVMLGVGAFYPAVDITAGEKERGTFETLLSTPARKMEIVWGKFLTVFLVSLVAGALNLASMSATFALQVSQLAGRIGELDVSIGIGTLGIVLLAMIPLAFFISAAMMAIAVLARSFKEAQNFVTPFFVLIIMPATVAIMPGTELTPSFYMLPIGNVALLFKELLMSPVEVEAVFAVIASTVLYAAGALFIAARLFQREEILLSEEGGMPITFRRDDFEPRTEPTLGLGLGLFAVVMLLIFYVGSYAQGKDLFVGLALTQWVLILAPVLFALWFTKIDMKSALNLHWPGFSAIGASTLFGLGWVVVAFQFGSWLQRVFPMPDNVREAFEEIAMAFSTEWSLGAVLFLVALSPAICEEVLFRGAILSSLRGRMPGWVVILLVGVLFGLFHMSIYRVVPTGLTGIALTYAVWRTRSILAGVIIHFINNAALILVSRPEVMNRIAPNLDSTLMEAEGLPWTWVVVGGVTALLGIAAIEMSARKANA